MNNWIPKNKIVRFAIASFLFSVILYFVCLLIVVNEIKKIENLYRNTDSELFKEEKFLAIKSIAEADKEPIQTLRDFFVQKGDEVKFIEKIEETARASSIKFEIVSIDVKVNPEDSFKEDIGVKMKMEGSWGNIIHFMDKLNKISFGVSIEKVNLDANSPGNWSGSIEFIIFREK
jgi:Tfp pilus assembly protein PilO